MKAIEKDGYYYDPPSWKLCPDCYDGYFPYPASEDGDVDWGRCPTCADSHKPGWLPIRYTPKEWKAAGGMLTDKTPCLLKTKDWDYGLVPYGFSLSYKNIEHLIIATSAGRQEEE